MRDGLYQVTTSYLCAGFTIKNSKVDYCAPILRKRMTYWTKIAIWIAALITMATARPTPYEIAEPYLRQWHAIQAQKNMPEHERWLRAIFPKYVSRPFADFHYDFWDHLWAIKKGVRPHPYVACWFRAGAKSMGTELGSVALGARGERRYGAYVHAIQSKANDHLANIRTMLEEPELARRYPRLARPQIGRQTSSIRGWNMGRLWTAGDFVMDAYGLDAGLRGARLGEQRFDFLVLDDVDEDQDTPGITEKKIEMITKKILPAGDTQELAVFFMQTLTHRDSIMARMVSGQADFLQDRIISMGGPLPIMESCVIERDAARRKWVILGGKPRWPAMQITEVQSLLDSWGYRAFMTEGLQKVDTPYEGAIFPAWDPTLHVITQSEFMKRFAPYIRTEAVNRALSSKRSDFFIPKHGYRYWAMDAGTTPGHPSVAGWAWQPGEGLPHSDCLFFYREMCRPKFPGSDQIELVSPLRLGMEVQDQERLAGEEKLITWRIGSHEQAMCRNSFEVDLPMVAIPASYNPDGTPLHYQGMHVDAIDTTDKKAGISTAQDLLMPEWGVPHAFRKDPRSGEPLDGMVRVMFIVPDDQGELYVDASGTIKALEAYDEEGFARTRWEFPKYRHVITAAGEEKENPRKIDDDAMDMLIAMCAKARFAIQQKSDIVRALDRLDEALRPENLPSNPHPMAEVSSAFWMQEFAQEAKDAKKSKGHFMKELGLK